MTRSVLVAGLLGVLWAFGCSNDRSRAMDSGLASADSMVDAWVEEGRIPGAVLLVVRNGDAFLHEAYGLASVDDSLPMSKSTVFDLASVTKVMATTYALMVLSDQGRIDVQASVATYLPDFTGGGRERITIRDLLTHRSGLPQWLPTYYHATDREEAYAYLRTVPLMRPVGQERHYSDLGFMLLGRVVEEVSGQSLDAFVHTEIYGPLGLRKTGFRPVMSSTSTSDWAPSESEFARTSHGNPFERRMVHDPDFGYRIDGDPDAWSGWRSEWLEGEVNDGNAYHAFRGVAGHAGLFSTADELGVLLQVMLDGGERDGRRLVSPETIAAFVRPTGDRQALGWQLPGYGPGGSFGHTGFTGTLVLGVPDQNLALVLLTNRQNFGVNEDTQYPDVGPLQRAVTAAVTGID
ncbi:MAG: hypothetical protein CMM26_06305 [Rhodospirillaceae bacterium]|nr:hypothetical protein [Rhodospirillaceae bacterium]